MNRISSVVTAATAILLVVVVVTTEQPVYAFLAHSSNGRSQVRVVLSNRLSAATRRRAQQSYRPWNVRLSSSSLSNEFEEDFWGTIGGNDISNNSNNKQQQAPNNVESSSSSAFSSDTSLLQALQARIEELQDAESQLHANWLESNCASHSAVKLPDDWVRRVDVGVYPLAAAGSSQGNVYIVNMESGDILTKSVRSVASAGADGDGTASARLSSVDSHHVVETLRILYGDYDGGGTLALAFDGTTVYHAGRFGSIEAWRLSEGQLLYQGKPPASCGLNTVLVTSLLLEKKTSTQHGTTATTTTTDETKYLWVGTSDGRLQAYAVQGDVVEGTVVMPLVLQRKPTMEWKLSSQPVLSVSVHAVTATNGEDEEGIVVVTTASGSVHVVSRQQQPAGQILTFYPPFDTHRRKSQTVFPLSACLLQHDDCKYSVAVGGNDGSLFLHALEQDAATGKINWHRPFFKPAKQLRPPHMAAVKCVASPRPGILLSAGLDGALRVWNLSDTESGERECLYQFVGYKVWLGSLWTDGTRIVSDGADNAVILHDFSVTADDDTQQQSSSSRKSSSDNRKKKRAQDKKQPPPPPEEESDASPA